MSRVHFHENGASDVWKALISQAATAKTRTRFVPLTRRAPAVTQRALGRRLVRQGARPAASPSWNDAAVDESELACGEANPADDQPHDDSSESEKSDNETPGAGIVPTERRRGPHRNTRLAHLSKPRRSQRLINKAQSFQ
ncbi:MAG: uncharacterized protein KVP18_000419 [Porospora cf. gigantea A]|uniref:uncharacterized protein n=1 Tax=Porospora cf. gigantea A TaxID=2853593 RepID=UPI00355A07B2|nr:MAG: hypothetical protein KVP18_000419 [Porospora cf. gigantea A]